MRIVWRDSTAPAEYKQIKYRGHYIGGSPGGWYTDIPGDDNLYANNYSAMNAIDAALGGNGVRGEAGSKRQSYGIQIVGKNN